VMADGRIASASLLAAVRLLEVCALASMQPIKTNHHQGFSHHRTFGGSLFIILKMSGSWLPAFSDPDGRMFEARVTLSGHISKCAVALQDARLVWVGQNSAAT
jgi:hypothetical protein